MTPTRHVRTAIGLLLLAGLLALAPARAAHAAVNPTITGVSPSSGPTTGGTQVTITGTGFLAGATVYVGGSPAPAVTVVSATQILATTPPGQQGSANILIVNTDGGVGTFTSGFFYTAASAGLTVSAVAPGSGPTGGGTLVTIVGTGFTGGPTVLFESIPATSVTPLGSSQLWARTPANVSGPVSVTIINPDGSAATLANGFTYEGAGGVVLTSVSPSGGLAAGGSVVTINGAGFAPNATVAFGATNASGVTVINSTQLVATTPPGIGTVSVTVTNPGGLFATRVNAFTYASGANSGTLTISGASPVSGPATGGTTITLTGTGFSGGATVLFGNAPSSNVQWLGASAMFVQTPAGAGGSVPITVINSDGTTATLPGGFTYTGTSGLAVSSISPVAGPPAGGTPVTINGNGFATGATVLFGNVPAASATVIGLTQIVATTPATASGTVNVTVTNPGGLAAVLPNGFTFGSGTPAPSQPLTVTSVTPASGPPTGGTIVTITGSGFLANASVLFGLLPGTAVSVLSDSQITATTPANTVASGAVAVTVVNPGGVSGSLAAAYSYGVNAGQLSVTAISPASGAAAGGTFVTITGSGFSSVASVLFGGTPGTGLAIASDSRLTVTAPARALGPVTVTVVNTGGSSATVPNGFLYSSTAATAALTTLTPGTGPAAGGTAVTLTGAGFAAGMTVTFGGNAATAVVVTSATQATAVTPARAAGAVDVVVSVGGQTATLAGGFIYLAAAALPPINLPPKGFGLFVFAGGTTEQMVTASGCPTATAAFYATTATGEFVIYVPGTTIGAVNAAWRALFPASIPAGTALIGKCS